MDWLFGAERGEAVRRSLLPLREKGARARQTFGAAISVAGASRRSLTAWMKIAAE